MSELRERLGKGLLLVALAGLLAMPPGCGDPEDLTFTSPSDTVDGDDPGANSLVEEGDGYLGQEVTASPEAEEEDGQN